MLLRLAIDCTVCAGLCYYAPFAAHGTYTWHTSLDTYERIIEEDVKKSATAIASVLYHLAMRDQMLPRFTKDTMPALPAPPAGAGSGR